MTLRVIIQIVPYGVEENAREIERLNISNIEVGFLSNYVIEHNEYKNYNDETPRVKHQRTDGALTLVRKAIEVLGH